MITNMKTTKIFDVTEKARIYHTLAQMSSSFSSIIRYCADLEQAGALTPKAKNRFQAFTVEIQGELNLEILEHMDGINYGPTPFGIHNDAEHSLLLHLGPDPKTVYLWPRRKFEKLQHRKPQKQYIMSQAITYKLKAGDLMFIPKGDYHVLESRRFSVSLGCSLFPATRKLLLSQMIDLIPDETNPSEPFFINWDPHVEFDHALCRALAGRSLEDDLHRYLLLVRSNGYVTAPPGEYLGDCTEDLMSGKRFRVPVEFPILCSRTKNRMLIVMRGRALTLRFHPSVLAVIHWLNRQTEFSYEELARRLRKVLDENAIKYLFQHLLRFRGVEFC
jgi:hypothetical protein